MSETRWNRKLIMVGRGSLEEPAAQTARSTEPGPGQNQLRDAGQASLNIKRKPSRNTCSECDA